MSEKGAVMVMLAGSLTTIVWHVFSQVTDVNLLGLEPLFAGLMASVVCFFVDKWIAAKRMKNAISSEFDKTSGKTA